MDFTIKIDSREQKPYTFDTPSEGGTVPAGDYGDRQRFEKELHKGKALEYFAVVIEGSLSDIALGNYRSKMQPKAAVQSLLAFSVRYRLPVFFCESREYGQRITESLLCKYARELEKNLTKLSKD
jgi:DNA excision repair protein ERCC-4